MADIAYLMQQQRKAIREGYLDLAEELEERILDAQDARVD